MRRDQSIHAELGLWRKLYIFALWLSITICLGLALILGVWGVGENARLVTAGLILFAGIGIAFATSIQRVGQLRWWHWALGAVLAAPAVLMMF